jgi:hypothetical protein
MNTLEIRSTLTLADWQAYQAAWALRLQARSRLSRRNIVVTVGVALAMAIALVGASVYLGQSVPFLAVVIGAAAAVLGVMINMRRMRAAAQPDESGVVLGPSRLTLDPSGMLLEKSHSTIRHDWAVFQEVTVAPGHLFIWVDRVAALIVPVRDLPASVSAHQAADLIRGLAETAQSSPAQAQAQIEPQSDGSVAANSTIPVVSSSSTQVPFLRSIGRFLTLRSVTNPDLDLSDRALLALAILSIGLWILIDLLVALPDSTFYAYGFIGVGWYASVAMLLAATWARLSDPPVSLRATLALTLAFVPIAIVLATLLDYLPSAVSLGASIILAFYAVAYGHTALKSLTARHQAGAMFASLVFLSLAAWFAQTQYVEPGFWYPDEDESAELTDEAQNYLARWRQIEPLLFGQAQFVDDAVAAMERPQDLRAAAFFLGFAGMGEERVFAGEINFANKVIGEKFGTGSRSLQLVNDRRDLDSHPFASPTALRRALAGIAERMNLEEDVLILSLSSHGSAGGELSVSNSGVPLNNLDAETLADALDESGIRWRVIIVSACYSGTFIEPLRNDDTIVITAAAADKTSFGCSDDRDLTYFGEAFYRDALPSAPDLRTAFQRTRDAIAQREEAEQIEASNPQAFFGVGAERKLRGVMK